MVKAHFDSKAKLLIQLKSEATSTASCLQCSSLPGGAVQGRCGYLQEWGSAGGAVSLEVAQHLLSALRFLSVMV